MRDDKLIEGMRESFEAWFSDDWQHPSAVERDAVGYKLAQAQNAWTVWLAALDAAFDLMQERDGWIPVSERLPPEGVDVLVLHDYGQIVGNPAHRVYGKRYSYKITRRYGNEFLSDLMKTGQATHWMPIPPAPQTEEPRGINVSGHTYVRRSATSYVCRRCGHDLCREEPKPCANQQPEEAP